MFAYPLNRFEPNEILCYLRKSRSDDPLLSVEEVLKKHETILDEWAEKNLSTVVPEENKYREVVSGETIDDRPEVQKLLKRIESPKIKAILIVEVQRLSRGDLEDAGRLIKLLRYTGTSVITPQKIYNLQDEYDRDIFERELKRGNEFLEYQKKIMNRGRLLSVSQGNFIGSIAPYGYKKIWISDGKRKCPTLEEDKETADVVRMIFDMYVNQDKGICKIANYLDDMKISPPKGEYWSPAALKDMLANEHYIGKVRWNWRKTVTVVENSEIIKTRPKSAFGEYLVFDGKHNGIVAEDVFNAAIDKRKKNHRAKVNTPLKNPFASLLYCHCGRSMSLQFFKKEDGTERTSPRLYCLNQKHCNTGSCTYSDMLGQVENILEKNIEDFEVALKNNNKTSKELHVNIIKSLEKKLKELEARELSQWEAQSDPNPENRMPQHIFSKLNEKLQKEKKEVQQAIQEAYESTPDIETFEKNVDKFKAALYTLRDPSSSAQEKNTLLKTCIERIEYTKDQPERLKRPPGEKKGSHLPVGGGWTEPKINLKIKLKI